MKTCVYRQGVIERYRKHLPVSAKTPVITMREGGTPLLRARRLEEHLGVRMELYLKCEGFNPTGSFKDRGMTVAISKAVEEGARVVITASTGNTAASAAAYAARSGLSCIVIIPDGAVAAGKLSQALMHGAKVVCVKGNFDKALLLVRELSENYPVTVVNSINPYRIEGQKTAAFEIIDALGDAPDYQFMPVGNAGNITAYWKGYREYKKLGRAKRLPRMMGFQAAGAAPIVMGHPVANPHTVATAIRIGNPASWKQAEEARDQSGGVIDMVTDPEILSAYRLIARMEGVFVEPASASGLAGFIKYLKRGKISRNRSGRATFVLTGHGLKDPHSALSGPFKPRKVAPDCGILARALGLK